jgi:uncharacterized membrane protein YgcG
MINDLQTILEVVSGARQSKERSSMDNGGRAKPLVKVKLSLPVLFSCILVCSYTYNYRMVNRQTIMVREPMKRMERMTVITVKPYAGHVVGYITLMNFGSGATSVKSGTTASASR